MSTKSWADIQSQLEQLLKLSQDLGAVLNTLYTYHRQIGFISDPLSKSIQSVTPIALPTINAHFWLQLNPERANRGLSSTVHPNPTHIIPYKSGIPCFCCLDTIQHQWPDERGFQIQILNQNLVFLPNPSPIFDRHFTIVSEEHRPQIMDIPLIIEIAQRLPGYWVIENGEGVGATNPWHFHLQTFVEPHLPIIHFPKDEIPSLFSFPTPARTFRLRLPTPVFNFEFQPNSPAIQSEIVAWATQYLSEDSHHRLTLLCQAKPQHPIQVYVALRDVRFRSPMYSVGQPGYAEIGGVISVVKPERLAEWQQNGAELFMQIMSDISPKPDVFSSTVLL